jgi:hemolysin D
MVQSQAITTATSPNPLKALPEKRNRDELAFLPAALEIVETPPSPAARLTALTLTSLMVITLAWSYFSKVDVVAVAEGRVIPIGQVKQVQPLEPGTVRTILVDEGDHVTAGQVLIEIDPSEQTANLEQATYDRMQALLDAESARVLLTGDPETKFISPAHVDPTLAEAMQIQTRHAVAKFTATMASFESQIEEKHAAIVSIMAQQKKGEETLPLLTERYEAVKTLASSQLAQAPVWMKARQDLIDNKAEQAAAEQRLLQTESEIKSLLNKRTESETAFRAEASDKRLRALQKSVQLEQQIKKEQTRELKRKLVAPVSGTVLGLKANTIGGVVTTADSLMTIVPDEARLEIDAQIQNQDIGVVKEGMAVEVKLEAFQFTRYGTVPGVVRRIGRDSVSNAAAANAAPTGAKGRAAAASQGSTPTGDLSYPARITLEHTTIMIDGKRQAITPGMKVVAEIKTDRRRVIEFLVDKIVATTSQAGKER